MTAQQSTESARGSHDGSAQLGRRRTDAQNKILLWMQLHQGERQLPAKSRKLRLRGQPRRHKPTSQTHRRRRNEPSGPIRPARGEGAAWLFLAPSDLRAAAPTLPRPVPPPNELFIRSLSLLSLAWCMYSDCARLTACDETPYAERIVDVSPQRVLVFHNDIHKRTCLAGRLDHFCHQLLFIDLVAA